MSEGVAFGASLRGAATAQEKTLTGFVMLMDMGFWMKTSQLVRRHLFQEYGMHK